MGAAWVAIAFGLAVLIAGVVRLADQHAERERASAAGTEEPNLVVDLRAAAGGAGTDVPHSGVPTARAHAAGGRVNAPRRAGPLS